MCHLSSFCEKFGMISCAYTGRRGRDEDCPFFRKREPDPVGDSTVEIPAARYFLLRHSQAK